LFISNTYPILHGQIFDVDNVIEGSQEVQAEILLGSHVAQFDAGVHKIQNPKLFLS
jgi:hypothetical protein